MHRLLSGIALVVSIAIAGPAEAGHDDGTQLAGVVVDASGAPLAGAALTVERDGVRVAATTSGSGGEFEIAAEGDGLVLRVAYAGFADAVLPLPTDTPPDAPLRVVLQPAGLSESVTVTASRSDERLATPASTAVITAPVLESHAAGAVDDVLRNTAGFGLTRRSSSRVANPSSQGVSMRGLPGNAGSRTLVLADGLPLNDPFGGWVYWNRVPEAAIERIEVVRGAAGDLYGGDAISGVVQLLTFEPQHPRARATFEGGSASTARGSVFVGGQRNNWNGSVAGEWVRTDGEPIVAAAERGPVDVPAFSNYRTAFATLGYDAGAWRLRGRASTYQEARGNGTPLVGNDTNWRQFSADASGQIGTGLWSVRGGGGSQHYYNNFSSVPVDRLSERLTNEQRLPSTFATGSAQWVQPWRSTVFLAGAEGKRTEATVFDSRFTAGVAGPPAVTGGVERAVSGYGRAAITPWPALTIVAGARGDFWRSTPQEAAAPAHSADFFSPRVSMSWQATRVVALRASATRASRTPTLDELHRSSRIGNTLTLGNPLLDPERLTGIEAGVSAAGARVSARASWFMNDLTNAITNVTLATTASQITRQKQNADHVRATGVELEGAFRPAASLSITGGAVFTSSRFRGTALSALEGRRVPQIPSVQLNGAVTWTDARVATLSAQVRGSNTQFEDDLNTLPLGGYGVVDVRVSRRLSSAVQAFVACENLFDAEYQTGKTGNPPVTKIGWPRTWRGGVTIDMR